MTDEGTPKKGADAAAKQRKQVMRKKARELASQQGKEWSSVPKEERKEFRKAARKETPRDLSSVLGSVTEAADAPKEDTSQKRDGSRRAPRAPRKYVGPNDPSSTQKKQPT